MEDDEKELVSTIENVVGGFGVDTLTGDARANTLSGGADGRHAKWCRRQR